MKKKLSRILSALLAVLMVISVMPLTAGATDGNYEYTVENGEATITKAKNTFSGEITIPSALGGYPVTRIGTFAFSNCNEITAITIPAGIKTIERNAFSNTNIQYLNVSKTVAELNEQTLDCLELQKITVDKDNAVYSSKDGVLYNKDQTVLLRCPSYTHTYNNVPFTFLNTVGKIADFAFAYCQYITSIEIPATVTEIGNYAFYMSGLSGFIRIPDNITSIGDCAFDDCDKLTRVVIPAGVAYIGDRAFTGDKLTDIDVFANNTAYSSVNGILFNADKTSLLSYPGGKTSTDYEVPSTVTSIGDFAFYWCSSLNTITLPDGVTSIGDGAFYGTGISEMIMPDSIICLGENVFSACSNLEKIKLPAGIEGIGYYQLAGCETLNELIIPATVKYIESDAFYGTEAIEDVYFYGTRDEWDNIRGSYEYVDYIRIHYLYCPSNTLNYHVFGSEIIKPGTHIENGLEKYTCICGYSYEQILSKTEGHSYSSEVSTPATHLTEGVMTYTCACGDSYTEAIAKTTEHKHNAVVTAPTCTEQGFTTYTCECGDSYVADYVKENGHSYTSEITTPATHLTEGVMTYTCACGDSYTEAIEKLSEHTYSTDVIAPTCAEQGFTVYTCECGVSYKGDFVSTTDHKDADGDECCDYCDKFLGTDEEENKCSHMCHKSGFMGFIWSILRLFYMIFGINPVCECGRAHH